MILYVCLDNCLSFRNHIILRDHLKTHEKDKLHYGELKKELAKKFPNDMGSYITGKTNFILSILRQYGIVQSELKEIQQANQGPVVNK